MAERRMFAKTIIDSDAFLDMPLSAQALYFHLSMRADDDGFVNNPKKIQRMIGASDDDCKLLIMKRFILAFESGVIVIKHWKIHNYIQKDRYKETLYTEEKKRLAIDEKNAYTESDKIPYIQDVYNTDTQVRKEKIKESIEQEKANKAAQKPKSKGKSFEEMINGFADDDELKNAIYAFIEMRKLIKKPMSERALTLLLNKLKRLSADVKTQIDILNQSILHSWQDVYPLKEDYKKRGANGVLLDGRKTDDLDGIL